MTAFLLDVIRMISMTVINALGMAKGRDLPLRVPETTNKFLRVSAKPRLMPASAGSASRPPSLLPRGDDSDEMIARSSGMFRGKRPAIGLAFAALCSFFVLSSATSFAQGTMNFGANVFEARTCEYIRIDDGIANSWTGSTVWNVTANPLFSTGATITLSSVGNGLEFSTDGLTYSNAISSVSATGGTVTFQLVYVRGAVGTHTLQLASTGYFNTTAVISIAAGNAAVLRFTEMIADINYAGADIQTTTASTNVVVEFLDCAGNHVNTTGNTVTISSTPSGVTTANVLVTTATGGYATFSGLRLNLVGNYTLTATGAAVSSTTSNVFYIEHAAAATADIISGPSVMQACATSATPFVAYVRDGFGNIATTASLNLTLTTSGTYTAIGGNTQAVSNGAATFSNFTIGALDGSEFYMQVTEATILGSTTTASMFMVSGPPLANSNLIFLTQPTTTASGDILQGTSGSVAVRLTDCAGNLATSASYAVYLTEFSGTMRFGTAGDCSSFTSFVSSTVASVNGIATFPTTAVSAAAGFSYFLFAHTTTANGTTLTSQFSTVSFPVVTGTSTTISFTTGNAPNLTEIVGVNNIADPADIVEVRLTDCFGNLVTTTGTFTVTMTSAPAGINNAYSIVTTTGTAGIATFTNLTITTASVNGTAYTLTATPSIPAAGTTSAVVTVYPGAPNHLAYTVQPGTTNSGDHVPGATGPDVVVTVLDVFNNTTATGNPLVTLSTTAGITLTGNSVNAANGYATFTALTAAGTSGTYQLLATSASVVTGAMSNPFTLQAGAATHLAFNIQPSTNCNGGTLNNFSVSLKDAWNNTIVTSGTFTVNFGTIGASTATVSPNTAFGNLGTTGTISGYTFTASLAGYYAITAATVYNGATVYGTSATFLMDIQSVDINDPTIPAVVCVNPMGAIQWGIFDACVSPLPMTNATVTATLSGPTTGVTGNVTTATNNWNGFFTNLVITDPVPGNYTLTFTTASVTGATRSTSSSFIVDAQQLVFTTAPATTCVSTVLSDFTLALRESCNNNINIATTVTLSVSGGATLTPSSMMSANGVATFSGVTFMTSTAGTYTVTATAVNWQGNTLTTSASFTVDASTIAFAGPVPSAIPCGTTTNFVTTFRDNCGNLVPSITNNVTVSIDNGGQLNGSTSVTVAAANGTATFTGVMVNGLVGTTYTLTASGLSATGATVLGTTTITITPGVPAEIVFSVEPSSTGTAGVNLTTTPQISVLDMCGNVVPTAVYQVSYSFDPASTSTSATMNVQPTNGLVTVNGMSTFTGLNIQQTGTYYLRAVANFVSYTPPTGYGPAPTQLSATSASVTILPNAPYQLAVVTQPPTVNLSNTFFTTATVVEVRDQFGNRVTTESGRTVSMAIASGTPGATLSGTTSTTTVNGVATFSSLKIDKTGTYTLSANSVGITSATTIAFDVISGPAVQLSYTVQPVFNQNITSASLFTVTVRTEDAGGNYVSTNATIGIQIGTNGGTYTSGTLTVVGSNPVVSTNGIASFTVSIDKIGQYTLFATGSSVTTTGTQTLVSTTSNLFNIVAGTPTKLAIINEPSNGTAGVALATQPYVQIQDAGGNPVSGGAADGNGTIIGFEGVQINTTVIFTPTPPYTTVATPLPFTVNANPVFTGVTGEAGFSGLTFYTAGEYQIVINHANLDGGPTFATATSATFTIVPNTASSTTSYVIQPTTSLTVGQSTTFTVYLRDAWNNRTTTGTMNLAVTYGDGNLSQTSVTGVTNATITYTAGTDATIDPPAGNADVQINLTIAGTDITGPLGTSSSPIFYDQVPDVPSVDSYILASANSAVVGGNPVGLTVYSVDQYGNPTTLGPIYVDVTNGGGTLANGSTGVTFNGSTQATLSGQFSYTFDYLTGTNASLDGQINAMLDNYAGLGGVADITNSPVIIDQLPSTVAVISTLSTNFSTIMVGGIAGNTNTCGTPTTATLTVSAVDQFGNPTTTGTVTVTLTQGGGTITNGGAGVVIAGNQATMTGQTSYSFDYRSGLDASINAVFTAVTSTGGTLSGSPLTIVQAPGVATTATSTIATTSTELEANGTATAFIVMQLRDIYNNTTSTLCAQTPGLTFVPSTAGSLVSSSAVNVGFGQYQWQFVAGTVAGITVEFTGNLNGLALATSTASIRLVPGPASITTSIVSASPNEITVGGATSTVTVQLRDAFGNAIIDDADCVRLFVTSGPGSVTQVPVYAGFGTGTWTGTYTSSGTPGQVVISAFLKSDGQPNCTFPGVGYQAIQDTAQINVVPGVAVAATSFITSTSSSVVVGQPMTFTVELRDQFNNPTTNGTVNIAVENGGGSLTATAGGTIVDATTGTVTGVTSATFTYTAGTNASLNAVIAARISGTHIVNSPLTIDQVPGVAVAANSYMTVDQTTLQVACPAPTATIAVQLRDQYGNNTGNLGGQSFVLTSSGPAGFGSINGQPITSVDATGATTATFTAGTTATISGSVTAQLNGTNTIGSPTTITQTPGLPYAVAIVTQPGNGTGGSPIAPQPVVRIVDCNGNTVTGNNGTVITAVIDSQVSPPMTPAAMIMAGSTAATVNGVATFNNLTIDKIGTYTLRFDATGVLSVTSSTFVISVGPAAQLAFVVQPSDTRAGDIMTPDVQVQVQDLGGNHVVTSASINLAIGTNPTPGAPGLTIGGGATVPTTTGTAVFTNLSINKAANGYTLYATGFTLGSGSVVLTPATSATFNIIPNAPARVAFRVNPPLQSTVAAVLNPAPVVEVQDAYGNYISTAATISIAIGNNPGGAVLSGTQTITTANGVATFSNLSLDKVGLGYTLVASAPGLLPGTSGAFDIVGGTPVRVVFIAEPSGNNIAAEPFTTQPVVEIQDIGGNRVFTNATVTVSIAMNGGTFTTGTLSGMTTLTTVNGRATFSGLSIDKIGNYTLQVASTGLVGDTTGIFTVITGAPYRLGFYTEPGNGVAGETLVPQPVVQVQDKGGNHISNNINTPVTLSVVTGPGSISRIDANPVNTFAGFANFSGLAFNIAGCYTIQASAPGLVSGTSATFCIVPNTAAATTSTISAPATVVAGQNATLTVTRRDMFGNLTTTGTVALAIAQGGGSLNTTLVNGNTVTTNVVYTAGTNAAVNAVITAQIGGTDIVGSPATIDIVPAPAVPAVSSIVSASPTVVAGQTVALTVRLFDQYGNPTTDGTVSLAIQQGGGSLSSSSVTGTTMATVTYTAGTNAAVDAVITAQITGANIVGSPLMIDIIPGVISATTSTVSPTALTVTVGSTATVTVSKRDIYGNPTTNGTVTATVLNAVAAGNASIAGVVDNGTTATVTYQAGTIAGANIAQIQTLANGVAIAPNVQVTQVAGPAVAAQSNLTPTSASVVVGGNTTTFTVNKRDIYGNPTTIGTVSVTITDNGTGGAMINTVDNGTTATITYTSGTTAGVSVAQVNARINGTHVQGSPASVTQVPATVSALTSTITPAGPATVTVGTTNTLTFTVTKRDMYGNLTTTGTVTVTGTNFGSNGGSINTVDNGTTMTVVYTAGTMAGNNVFQINARVGGTDIINSPILINQVADVPAQLVVVDAGNPNAPLFDVFTTPPPVLAEASQGVAFPVTLGLVDAYGNVTNANATVTVTVGGTAGASGSFTFQSGLTTTTSNVTPTTGGSNLTVTFADGPTIASTTLTITTVNNALSLTYPTPQNLTQFQPAITINPVRNGGRAPFTYSIVAGALPPGLTFNTATGVITGTPTDTVLLADTTLIRVVDVNGNFDQARIQWKVNPALTIFYATTNTLVINQDYSIDPVITGGTAPYTFGTVSGALPAGMSLNMTTGRISGAPTTTGTYTVTVKGTDVNGATDNATLTITVVTSGTQPTAVNVKVVLQGAHTGGGAMSTALNLGGLIPTTDPYGQGVTVAAVPANAVDWVELEFRSATNNTVTIADTVGFLMNNGAVVAPNGSSPILMSSASLPPGSYYVVVRHRNHLAIMSSVPAVLSPNSSSLYDFTTAQGQAYSTFQFPMIQVNAGPDVYAMVAGDENQDGVVNATDRVNVRNDSGATGYRSTDLSMDGLVNAVDRVLSRNNTFRATQVP